MTLGQALAAGGPREYSRQEEVAILRRRRNSSALREDGRLGFGSDREFVQLPEPGVLTYGLVPPAGSVPMCGGAI